MPYNGVPEDKTDEMERCVADVMSRQHKDKSTAIAICHASIVGKKPKSKKVDLPLKGGDKNMKDKKIEKKDEVKKDDEVKTEAAPAAEAAPAEVKEEQPVEVAEAVADENVAPEEKKEEAKVEEPVKEPVEEKKEEAPAEVKEEKKEEAPAVKPDEPAKAALVPDLNVERLSKIEELLEKAATLIAKMSEVKKVQDQAPTEGAPDANKETLEPKAEEAKEEAKAEEVKPEVTPEPAKSDTSSGGASEAEATVSKALEDFKTDILKRLDKLESMPAPSKAKVFSKNFDGDDSVDDQKSLDKVEKRLEEIDGIRKNTPYLYTNELIDEAFKLIEEKKTLKG